MSPRGGPTLSTYHIHTAYIKYTVPVMRRVIDFLLGKGCLVFAKEQAGTMFPFAYLYLYIGLVTGNYKAVGS